MGQLHASQTTVITNCTSRKRRTARTTSLEEPRTFASLQAMARHWTSRLAIETPTTRVKDLYVGRAFGDALATAKLLEANFWVVSAGLGLVNGESLVPGYDLTTSGGPTSIAPQLRSLGCTPSAWWEALGNVHKEVGKSIAAIVNNADQNCVFLALPSTYIELVVRDLERIDSSAVGKLRIFTSASGLSVLPIHLRSNVLPYDERLETSSVSGTRVDFAQRAMRHFVEELQAHHLSLPEAHDAVSMAMERLSKRTSPARTRADDAAILAILKTKWAEYGGSSTRLLRYLRDIEKVSCEQSRFKDLCRSLKCQVSV